MNGAERGERTVYRDPVTGREVWRVTDSEYADVHAYYDVNPYSPDGRYILFSSALPAAVVTRWQDNLSTTNGKVHILDTSTWTRSKVAGDALFTTHTGAFAIWHPNGRQVFYRHRTGQVGAVDVESHASQVMEGDLRQLSPDGRTIVWPNNDPAFRQGAGIYAVNADGTDIRLVVSAQRIYDLTPQEPAFDIADMHLQNTKWHPDGIHVLLAIRVDGNPAKGYDKIKHLYVIGADGGEARWLTDYDHHHSWTPDGRSVLYCDWLHRPVIGKRSGPRLYLIDMEGTNRRMVIDEPLGGHPLMNPAGDAIVTWDGEGIILVRPDEGSVERLATFRQRFDQSHRGTHPHAVWRQDGGQILYNSAETGRSQIYVLPMDE